MQQQSKHEYRKNPLQLFNRQKETLLPGLIIIVSEDVPRLLWLARTCWDGCVPLRSSVRGGLHLDHIVGGGGSVGGVSPRVGIQVDEREDERVHEKCDTSREQGESEGMEKQGLN